MNDNDAFGNVPSNLVDKFGKWFFPCIEFDGLYALNDFVNNSKACICVANQMVSIICCHFAHKNYNEIETDRQTWKFDQVKLVFCCFVCVWWIH